MEFLDDADFKKKAELYLENLKEHGVIKVDFDFDSALKKETEKIEKALADSFTSDMYFESLDKKKSKLNFD